MHRKCSDIRGKLTAARDFKCQRCHGFATPIDNKPIREFMVDGSALQVVDSFCYPCDMLSAGGGSELSSTIRVKTAWGKYRQLILTASSLTLTTRGRVYHIYVHSVLTYMPVSAGHRLNLLWPECNEMTEL